MATNLALEEEFFAVEGRPEPCASRACAYVARLEMAPNGDPIPAEQRAALWYLAYWAMESRTSPSIRALAMHLHLFEDQARTVLLALMAKGVIRLVMPLALVEWRHEDVHGYEFAELVEGGK
jgi:hypothetical protein